MPQTYQFASKARDQKVIFGRAEDRLAPNGTMMATKQPDVIEFTRGLYSTTSKDKAEFLRKRIADGHLEAYEVSPHAQAKSEAELLGRVSALTMQLHGENHEDAVAELRAIWEEEINTAHRESVTGPLEGIFKTLEISPRKPGRPAGK